MIVKFVNYRKLLSTEGHQNEGFKSVRSSKGQKFRLQVSQDRS